MPFEKSTFCTKDKSATEGGILSRKWFAEKVWNFDYENHTLSWGQEDLSENNPSGRVPFYFKANSLEDYTNYISRILFPSKGDSPSFMVVTNTQVLLSKEVPSGLNLDEEVADSSINESTFI